MSNIKLAIRVRPFSERELQTDKECARVVSVVDDHTVAITNVKVNASGAGDSRERVRRYQADYTFDSSCAEDSPQYASQQKVFDTLGSDVLSCIKRGTSACVLAYGQSSTGKTHTMMGTDLQPGLIPRLCNALAALEPYEITVSFLEIYNEKVHDLLVGEEQVLEYASLPRRRGNCRKDLRVREHPARGPYVQNLRRVVVKDAACLLALVSDGARRRRTAATRRNLTSSRSHALLELSTPLATLHLADLAGSEKASWEGCIGRGRQKEGANINKSLVALSNVISALVNSGTGRGRFVPYRDSALTWLLKDCFTGGAEAFIITTVSPSVSCYGESASTLRWALRARQLRVWPQSRCNSLQATRAALQAQLQQILAELTKNHIRYIPETGTLVHDESHWTIKKCDKVTDFEVGAMSSSKAKRERIEMANSGSTTSSVASGSSEMISVTDRYKKNCNEINKEVDKLFGPPLERTRSGSDIKVVPPLRHKKRQYKSQEVLPFDNKTSQTIQESRERKISLQNIGHSFETENFKDTLKDNENKILNHVPLIYDTNQRAEIVASVTERLYSKLKKKEESAITKVENIVDKKIMEPLSELKICTNARQRLIELGQKTFKNRRRIGIPAYTQTKCNVTRVKNQGIDIQTDLEPYAIKKNGDIIFYQNVGTETNIMTPRCKDISVGPQFGSVQHQDRTTHTDTNQLSFKNSSMMTDTCIQNHCYTQTSVIPPPRKKRSMSHSPKNGSLGDNYLGENLTPIISINISQSYPLEHNSTSSSEDSVSSPVKKSINIDMKPDLLTNHSSVDNNEDMQNIVSESYSIKNNQHTQESCNDDLLVKQGQAMSNQNIEEIFSDVEEDLLPRVTVDKSSSYSENHQHNDLILGRNNNIYPYNIVLSPARQKIENGKRSVKFKDLEVLPSSVSVASQTAPKNKTSIQVDYDSENDDQAQTSDSNSLHSNSTISSKCTDTFVWRTGSQVSNSHSNYNSNNACPIKDYCKPVTKRNGARYNKAKTKMYKEFLGLRSEPSCCSTTTTSSDERTENFSRCRETENHNDEEKAVNDFREKRDFFENKGYSIFNRTQDPFYDFETKLLKSCDRLDASINKYDAYLKSYQSRSHTYNSADRASIHIKPKEYLHHLVEIRKNIVKGNSSDNVSSGSIF